MKKIILQVGARVSVVIRLQKNHILWELLQVNQNNHPLLKKVSRKMGLANMRATFTQLLEVKQEIVLVTQETYDNLHSLLARDRLMVQRVKEQRKQLKSLLTKSKDMNRLLLAVLS